MSPRQRIALNAYREAVADWAVECGGRVAARRVELQLDRRQLAARVGVTEATVARIEHGQLNPRDHLKWALASVMRIDVADLWSQPPLRHLDRRVRRHVQPESDDRP